MSLKCQLYVQRLRFSARQTETQMRQIGRRHGVYKVNPQVGNVRNNGPEMLVFSGAHWRPGARQRISRPGNIVMSKGDW